jgi:hypothetical protein
MDIKLLDSLAETTLNRDTDGIYLARVQHK